MGPYASLSVSMALWATFRVLLLMLTCHSASAEHGKFTDQEKKSIVQAVNKFKEQNTNDVYKEKPVVEEIDCKAYKLDEQSTELCVARIEHELQEWNNKLAEASWLYETNITDYNADKLTEATNECADWVREQVTWARKFQQHPHSPHRGISQMFPSLRKPDARRVQHPEMVVNSALWDSQLKRKLKQLSVSTVPNDATTQNTISSLSQTLSSIYAQATISKNGTTYRLEPELTEIMSTSRDWEELKWAWQGWRDATGPLMKEHFTNLVAAQNEGAVDNGFADMGEAWRVQSYEVDNIEEMTEALYNDFLPLYQQLHAYVRRRLVDAYPGHVDPRGPIPAHILGDMWAQQWTNILDLVMPFPDSPSFDITPALLDQGYGVMDMFKLSEHFFATLGLDNMTDVFWQKSMLTRPEDGRDVVCHASAYDFFSRDCTDFRIKMCTEVNMEYLQTIHHEMGHIQYFQLYCPQSQFFKDGANAAMHEAVGDTIALSVMTPEHLQAIGLLPDSITSASDEDKHKMEINFLMKAALEKVAFIPFGYLIDKWRWEVFRGAVTPANYNAAWWDLRTRLQGVAPPGARSEKDFDPGAKFHVAASVPYIRYFLSFIGQFQFHKALCDAKGHVGPLHRCDIYRSIEAGDLLKRALSLGSSKPWPDVMEIMTGSREFSTVALMDYFAPLHEWLIDINGKDTGWL